jgi:hypothetical protein
MIKLGLLNYFLQPTWKKKQLEMLWFFELSTRRALFYVKDLEVITQPRIQKISKLFTMIS